MRIHRITIFLLTLVLTSLLNGCTSIPENVIPISPFKLGDFLGHWYEIGRIDNSFESGLTHVSAFYTLNEDGSIKVVNAGWNPKTRQWKQATGKAWFVSDPAFAHLKVSFFGPFYSSYIVFYMAKDGSAALVSGYKKDYLWILSRTQMMPAKEMVKCIEIARRNGFDVSKLIFPSQTD